MHQADPVGREDRADPVDREAEEHPLTEELECRGPLRGNTKKTNSNNKNMTMSARSNLIIITARSPLRECVQSSLLTIGTPGASGGAMGGPGGA